MLPKLLNLMSNFFLLMHPKISHFVGREEVEKFSRLMTFLVLASNNSETNAIFSHFPYLEGGGFSGPTGSAVEQGYVQNLSCSKKNMSHFSVHFSIWPDAGHNFPGLS